jgi:hypothetical protein
MRHQSEFAALRDSENNAPGEQTCAAQAFDALSATGRAPGAPPASSSSPKRRQDSTYRPGERCPVSMDGEMIRSWARIIWRCWQNRTPYDPARHTGLQQHILVTIPEHRAAGPTCPPLIKWPLRPPSIDTGRLSRRWWWSRRYCVGDQPQPRDGPLLRRHCDRRRRRGSTVKRIAADPRPTRAGSNGNRPGRSPIRLLTMEASTRALGPQPCKVAGCERPSHLRAHGFCGVHYGLPGHTNANPYPSDCRACHCPLATARSQRRQVGARRAFPRWRRAATVGEPVPI